MVKTKLLDFATTDETPFIELEDVSYTKYFKPGKTRTMKDMDTQEIHSYTEAGEMVTDFNDRGKFTKIFNSGRIKLSELSAPGVKVLCYIMMHLTPNKEELYLHTSEVAKEMGYKNQKNVYDGIVDLLNLGLLARKTGTQPVFWINPNMYFNGNRIALLENPTRVDFVQYLIDKKNQEIKEHADSLHD